MSTPPSASFNYPTPYRIGPGRVAELADSCDELGLRRPLLVSDPGIVALPWFAALEAQLAAATQLEVARFAAIQQNPTGEDVAAGVAAYRAHAADGLILVGGGSALDVGKCIALLVDNPGSVFDYEDVGGNYRRADPDKVARKIAVPTTAGTGSEVGRASVIVDEQHRKQIIFHPNMLPELVIADPELCVGLPPRLTAATGMDAFAHCFEALCAPGYHPMADGIALEGLALIQRALLRAYVDGEDLDARMDMLMAASMGATAFQKGLGLVHALSHPLGGATGLHHGTANAIFLPYVMVFNRPAIAETMERLARLLGLTGASGFDAVLDWVLELRRELGLPHTLAGVPGISEALLEQLAPLAVDDPSMAGNPVPADAEACAELFVRALRGELGR